MGSPVVGSVGTILSAMDARCPSVADHSRRVSAYSVRLALQYGLAQDVIETIRIGALLHDIGKLTVPARILAKPGRLTEREWAQLRSHPQAGVVMVERLGFDADIAEIVVSHHERIDGSGYPDRLLSEAIAWPVRIVSVMDAFDALTSPRAYREALTIDAAQALLAREAGSRYCPWVVSGLLSMPKSLLQAIGDGVEDDGQPEGLVRASTAAFALEELIPFVPEISMA